MKQVKAVKDIAVCLRWMTGETYWAVLKKDKDYKAEEAEKNCYRVFINKCYEVPDQEAEFPCITLCNGIFMLLPRSWFNEVNENGEIK